MKEKRELVKNTIIISIGKFSTRLINFLLLPLYTSFLLPEEKGIVDLLNRISLFLMPLITLQMDEALFRFLMDTKKSQDKKEIFSQVIIFSFVSSLFWGLVILIIGKILHYPYTIWLIIYSMASFVYAISDGFLRGEGKLKAYSIIAFINSFLNIILNIFFLVILDTGLEGMFLSYIIATLTTGIIGLIYVKAYKYIIIKHNKKLMMDMFKYSLPIVPSSISWSILALMDSLIITTFLGPAMNGIYSTSNTFPTVMNTFYGFFNIAWRGSASKIIKKSERDVFYCNVYLTVKHLLVGISLLIIGFLPLVFNFLVNKNYSESYLYVPLMIISVYFSSLASFSSAIFSAYKDTKILATTAYMIAFINLVIDLLFIRQIGLFAPILGTLISYLVVYLYRNYRLRKYIILPLDKYLISNIIILSVVISTYYSRIVILKIFGLVIAIIYSYYINRELIKKVIKSGRWLK